MADKKTFGTSKYAAAMAASFLVLLGGMLTTIVLSVAAGSDPFWSVVSSVALFGLISLIPLRALRPERGPQFPRARPREGFWTVLKQVFERQTHDSTPLRPWKRKDSNFVPEPHGSDYFRYKCFVPERPEKDPSRE
jgi:hypothetical protein